MEKKKLAGLSSFRLVNSLRSGIFYSFLVLYLREYLGLSVTEASLLTSFSEVISSATQFLVWGPLSDRVQKRMPFILGGQIGAAVAYLIIFVVHKGLMNTSLRVAGLFLVFALASIEFLWSAPQVCWSALLSDVTTHHERPSYLSAVFSIMSIGRVLGLVISGFLYQLGGYEGGGFAEGYLFYILIIGIMLSVTLNVLTLHDVKRPTPQLEQTTSSAKPLDFKEIDVRTEEIVVEKEANQEKKSLRLFYWLLIALVFTQFAQATGLQTFLYFVRLEPVSASAVAISFIVASKWIGLGLISPIAGHMARKFGNWTIVFGMVLMATAPFLFQYMTYVWHAMVLMGLTGVALGILFTVGYLIVADLVPEKKRARLFGLYNGVRASTWGVGPTLFGGPIADYKLNHGSTEADAYIATFLTAGLLGLIAIVIYEWKIRRGLPR